jgi:hypothetical protein
MLTEINHENVAINTATMHFLIFRKDKENKGMKPLCPEQTALDLNELVVA